ncbi:hypothetical protein E8L90_08670 [Brevibacillus antibioticus]|uniref:Beta-lactamase family protein n=1 Tax=Brevibacillus antibioticus TaxID=2570228 RepID=A0A4U2Y6S8_9BACL|nr:hypothetical protein [Brevibacillus antibioticus]TKI55512.1 hypothetical protein E8L90_08670 [Brevibacillus antibioticus]
MANLETAERLSPQSIFEPASVSKAFTAMGIMILSTILKRMYGVDGKSSRGSRDILFEQPYIMP